MKLSNGLHLTYSTNIHRGETWSETLAALNANTLAVRRQVSPDAPYGIGLRLSDQAARELSDRGTLKEFQGWLERHNCYVFTINGFPFGRFHGGRVKEQVYAPDWTSPERVEYTSRLFDLLVKLLPEGVEGSVSTVPGSFKEFITLPEQRKAIRDNLWRSVEEIARLSEVSGKVLHLGLEPEPLCLLETSVETVRFFEEMQEDRPGDERLRRFLGVNYDTCHLAVEYEEPSEAVARFRDSGVRVSKLHLSSALKVRPTPQSCQALRAFADDVYLHQVVARTASREIRRYRDLDVALSHYAKTGAPLEVEWRIHFHVPLHSSPTPLFGNTADHILGVLDIVQADPGLCSHLEMETYTWEVLPADLKQRSVVDQLVGEYEWCLDQLARRGTTPLPS